MKIYLFICFLLFLSIDNVLARENEVDLLLTSEFMNKTVKVSGALKVGAMYEDVDNISNFDELYLFIPDNTNVNNSKACVQIRSMDGKYFAEGSVQNLKESGKYKVHFKTDHKKELSLYKSDELVILTSIEKDCLQPSKKTMYIPASWNNETINTLVVYLNSGTQKTFYSLNKDQKPIKCETIPKDRMPITYDVRCLINYDEDLQNLIILREDFGTFFTPISFKILQ